jgi:hypothetical protein
MLRRAWLKAVLGTITVGIIARDWLDEAATAQEPVALLPPPPTSLLSAIGTNSAAPVASYILAYPTAAASASIANRGKMLSLMGASVPDLSDIWTTRNLRVQAEYERAALVILKGIERRPEELAALVKSVGGKAVIERRIPAIQSTDLKKIATAAIQ